MDAFDDGSDLSESQASEVMHDLLENSSSKATSTNNPQARATSTIDVNFSKDNSSDSYPSSRSSNSAPHYHLYGLATTQSQTQQYEDDGINESSQKENIGSSSSGNHSRKIMITPVAESLSVRSSSRSTAKKPSPPEVLKYPLSHASKQGNSKFMSTEVHSSARPSNNWRENDIRHESEESSQDSFARAASQDPAEQYIARAKQFVMPLSELERSSMSTARRSDAWTDSTRPNRETPPDSSSSVISKGRVLVEATPSHSGRSQSPSEITRASPPSNRPTKALSLQDGDGHPSTQEYASSSPASSYAKLFTGDTQPQDSQITQPSTQQDVQMEAQLTSAPWNLDAQASCGPSGNTISASTVAIIPPKSLLAMVNPQNRWRYQAYQNQNYDTNQPSHTGSSVAGNPNFDATGDETQPSIEDFSLHRSGTSRLPHSIGVNRNMMPQIELQETQPSDENIPPLTANTLIPRTGSARPASRAVRRDRVDPLDVVPDSEPLRDEHSDEQTQHASSRAKATDQSKPSHRLTPIPESHSRSEAANSVVHEQRIIVETRDLDIQDMTSNYDPVERDEDEDDDEEMPLALKLPRRAGASAKESKINKGKGKAVQRVLPKASTSRTNPISSNKVVGKSLSSRSQHPEDNQTLKNGRTFQMDQKVVSIPAPSRTSSKLDSIRDAKEVPSSVPEQDILQPSRSGRQPRANKEAKRGKATQATPLRQRSTRSNGVKHPRTRTVRDLCDEDKSDEMSLPEEEEEGTEPADPEENYMDVIGDASGSSRKRKRAPTSRTATSKGSLTMNKLNKPTPITRQTKRLRSVVVSGSRTNIEPTRVFALWKGDGHFYSGVLHSYQGNSRYLVKFDDETEGTVNINNMRAFELRVGDDVLRVDHIRSCKVISVDKIDSDIVGVGSSDCVEEIPISDIRIAHKTVTHEWNDRMLSADSVVTVIRPVSIKTSPTPSRTSLLSVQSGRGNRNNILLNTGLIVTLSVGNENREKDKVDVMAAIRNSGGIVVEDLSSIIRMEGKHTHSNRRWVITKSDAQWIGSDEIHRLFLVADEANQKPKFLTALALGIPCVFKSWLNDCINAGEEKDWLAYLLPQGFSEPLKARPSQQVDVDWGNSVHQLRDIMSNAVASKLFSNHSILCVGAEMVPQPKGKRIPGADKISQDANNAIARIILAMGAERVEAVTEVRYASQSIAEYTLVVIREPAHYTEELTGGNTVHWPWVKDCLIASRCLPLPNWDLANSQEA